MTKEAKSPTNNRIDELRYKYLENLHRMQTGVGLWMVHDDKDTSPKHLRVGVNAALVEVSALCSLLISKGVITETEYLETLVEAFAKEIESYETRLKNQFGVDIKL